jgi:hypothetical protein
VTIVFEAGCHLPAELIAGFRSQDIVVLA